MKTNLAYKIKLASLVLSLTAFASAGYAQLTIPYADGSDGALNITSGTNVIDLSQAVTGVWTNTSASPGNGTYDPTQWAVVFKYSSVNIASGAVVTFLNHPTHAPVVWLVDGDVEIDGELSLDGQNGQFFPGSLNAVEPGPGGFRGGALSPSYGLGSGYGPGGGSGNGGNGSYSDYPYGATNIVPLIGGSGAAGWTGGWSGGGGGGAMLIAASGQITINGYFHADGGFNASDTFQGGSGGAIRLVANQILGNGTLEAVSHLGGGDVGRIRLEANGFANTITVNPSTVAATPANPPVIFPSTNAPTVTVLSVAGQIAPTDPTARVSPNTGATDLALATTNVVTIVLQTMNFPTNGTVNVYIKPLYSAQSVLSATCISGNANQALWQVSTALPYPDANVVIQAHAVAP